MRTIVFFALLGVMAGCSGGPDPLIGKWTASLTPQTGVTLTLTINLNADKTLVYDVAGTGTCSGTLHYSGFGWSDTATTLSTTGTASCSGAGVTCGATTLDCGSTGPSASSCSYTLGANNTTLVLSGCAAPNDTLNATYTHSP